MPVLLLLHTFAVVEWYLLDGLREIKGGCRIRHAAP
jgi:hypothetical protein